MTTLLNYEPIHFLRCHSYKNDSGDVQTQVWQCAFEPNKPEQSALLATCGGNSLCLIEPNSGKVRTKFYVDIREKLLTLGWGSILSKLGERKVVVTAGARSTLYVLDPASGDSLLVHRLQTRVKSTINALTFHTKVKNVFFCGSSDGTVLICELQFSANNEDLQLKILVSLSVVDGEILCLAFDGDSNTLLSGTNKGLSITRFVDLKSLNKTKTVLLRLPKKHKLTMNTRTEKTRLEDRSIVDTVEVLRDGLIAVKYALHGKIYVCDISNVLDKTSVDEKKIGSIELVVVKCLNWSDTDNYFMNLGVSKDHHWLGCGDDQGDIWLYDLKAALDNSSSLVEAAVDPVVILPWPILDDPWAVRKRKLNLDVYDIVVDKVAISSGGRFVAAVTNNNMVCLWKLCDGGF